MQLVIAQGCSAPQFCLTCYQKQNKLYFKPGTAGRLVRRTSPSSFTVASQYEERTKYPSSSSRSYSNAPPRNLSSSIQTVSFNQQVRGRAVCLLAQSSGCNKQQHVCSWCAATSRPCCPSGSTWSSIYFWPPSGVHSAAPHCVLHAWPPSYCSTGLHSLAAVDFEWPQTVRQPSLRSFSMATGQHVLSLNLPHSCASSLTEVYADVHAQPAQSQCGVCRQTLVRGLRLQSMLTIELCLVMHKTTHILKQTQQAEALGSNIGIRNLNQSRQMHSQSHGLTGNS